MSKVKTAEELETEVLDQLREEENEPTHYIEDDLPCSDIGVFDYE